MNFVFECVDIILKKHSTINLVIWIIYVHHSSSNSSNTNLKNQIINRGFNHWFMFLVIEKHTWKKNANNIRCLIQLDQMTVHITKNLRDFLANPSNFLARHYKLHNQQEESRWRAVGVASHQLTRVCYMS